MSCTRGNILTRNASQNNLRFTTTRHTSSDSFGITLSNTSDAKTPHFPFYVNLVRRYRVLWWNGSDKSHMAREYRDMQHLSGTLTERHRLTLGLYQLCTTISPLLWHHLRSVSTSFSSFQFLSFYLAAAYSGIFGLQLLRGFLRNCTAA